MICVLASLVLVALIAWIVKMMFFGYKPEYEEML